MVKYSNNYCVICYRGTTGMLFENVMCILAIWDLELFFLGNC